ncbi:MAG: 30S ribosomal protein S7 [Candidatus Aenigmarchaeota archaeon]|nr:30S ribosomal protein S7 [Candidatus Aenigmarchaeota archaeon]
MEQSNEPPVKDVVETVDITLPNEEGPKAKKEEAKPKKRQKYVPKFLLFGRWDTSAIEVKDKGLLVYMNLSPVLIPRNYGRHAGRKFHKFDMSIVERLMNKMMIPGHKSKKHVLSSGSLGGKSERVMRLTKEIFSKIEQLTKQNPVQILVTAIENVALLEEITAYQMGGIMVRKAVVTSPQRRIDWALRLITQAAYQKSFNNKKNIVDAMAAEIIACYNKDVQNSNAMRERERIEREAEGAR